ncbi:MAG: type II secretion system secretin GspD [Alphaproteobacteria bacterium]|nr:type II secretion system secretin GspD [Alphaproteobacteria bacterium]
MRYRSTYTLTGLALCLVLCGLGPASVALAQSRVKAPEPISLNFVNADIDTVARALANLTGRNLVLDPRVKGTMTLSTEKPMPPEQAWAQFLSALRLQSFAVVEVNGLFKVVPEAEAKLQGGGVVAPSDKGSGNGQVLSQIFRLQHENANQLVAVLRPLISPNNTINVNPGTNSLVITDYADNLQRLARIIASLDTAQATDIEIIPLQHALAIDLAPLLQRLIDSSVGSQVPNPAAPGATPIASSQAEGGYRTTVLAEQRSNSLILRAANPARLMQARSLAEKLDRPGGPAAAGNIHVVYLKNADATKLANTLRAALAVDGRGVTGTTGVTGLSPVGANNPVASPGLSNTGSLGNSGQATASTTGGQIQADPATNSLIISAPEPVYRQLRAVIDQLDGRRAQVLVESIIAEVDANKASQFGVQWQNAIGSQGGNVGIIGTNFSTGGIANNILSISRGNQAPGAGLNIGTGRQIDGNTVLTSLANFLQQIGGSNILSTPTLLTLDNEEAKIVVGQNVPFLTGQFTTNTTNAGTVNPFQTFERRDVGITLKVKPQISETGTVKLTIFQEVSSVVTNSIGSTSGLITNKRSIESNVLVDDGQVVVLGGLLSDEYNGSSDQVPGLGNVPILGALFRSESRERRKTNLMVFLRPVVLRDAAAAENLSGDRYQNMLGLQRQTHVPASGPMTVENNMTLPPVERKP